MFKLNTQMDSDLLTMIVRTLAGIRSDLKNPYQCWVSSFSQLYAGLSINWEIKVFPRTVQNMGNAGNYREIQYSHEKTHTVTIC